MRVALFVLRTAQERTQKSASTECVLHSYARIELCLSSHKGVRPCIATVTLL